MFPFGSCTYMMLAVYSTDDLWTSFQHLEYKAWFPGAHWMGLPSICALAIASQGQPIDPKKMPRSSNPRGQAPEKTCLPCRGWWKSRLRTGVRKTVATDPAPVGNVAIGTPRCAVAVAIIRASVCLPSQDITSVQAAVGIWESDCIDHGGYGGKREGGQPDCNNQAMGERHV